MLLERNISFLDKDIHFKKEGKGKTIILLHGFLESLNMWNEFSQKLSKTHKVISIDLPGHGQSQVVNDIHSMELMAEAVKKVLDRNGVKKCIMVGHSMGGYVTLAFAEKYPEMLKGISLFHSNANADSPEAKINRSRAIAVVRQNHKDFIKSFIPELFAPENKEPFKEEIEFLLKDSEPVSEASIVAALEGMKARTSKIDFISKTEFPVLFIVGKKDPRADLNQLFEQISKPKIAEALILGNCGHMGYIEKKEITLKAIKAFADKYI